MCPSRRSVRFALPLAAIAVAAIVVRFRRGADVWHVAGDPPPDHITGDEEGS